MNISKRSHKKIDPDILALKTCIRGLNKCKSRRMVRATLAFLEDYYLAHPSSELPSHLKS